MYCLCFLDLGWYMTWSFYLFLSNAPPETSCPVTSPMRRNRFDICKNRNSLTFARCISWDEGRSNITQTYPRTNLHSIVIETPTLKVPAYIAFSGLATPCLWGRVSRVAIQRQRCAHPQYHSTSCLYPTMGYTSIYGQCKNKCHREKDDTLLEHLGFSHVFPVFTNLFSKTHSHFPCSKQESVIFHLGVLR